jgi:hypothetical protein
MDVLVPVCESVTTESHLHRNLKDVIHRSLNKHRQINLNEENAYSESRASGTGPAGPANVRPPFGR